MNTQFQRSMLLPTITNCALTLAGRNVFGLGGDYSNGQTVNQPAWPVGMVELVNTKSRVGGMFVSAEDIFFYSGKAPEFSAFLEGYSKIQDIERHRLILHQGAGETDSMIGGNKRPCDWKLQGRPGAPGSKFLMGLGAHKPRFILEVHFWTEGRLALEEVVIPGNIEVVNARLNALT
jgi:hypothetical protein